MDFDFTEEQLMLRQMTRELLATESTAAKVRQLAESPEGYSPETWQKLAELGLLGVTIPEAFGGQGLGMVEQALILDEMGRAALPSPYFATSVLAAGILIGSGNEALQRRYLPGIASGQIKATLALLEETPAWGPESVQLLAQPDGESWQLNGVKWLVPYAHVADVIIVVARTPGSAGPTIFAIDRNTPGVEIQAVEIVDLSSRVSRVTFRNVCASPDQVLGQVGGAASILNDLLRTAAVAASAEMLGAARKCLEMAVEYAKTREQFGQPIGTFQAIKHKCADMYVEVEESHSATYYAAWALSAGAPNASLAASVAKAYVSDAARKVCSDAIQVHGGMGFTWDYDLHLYFKHAKHLEPLYGDARFHRERALELALEG